MLIPEIFQGFMKRLQLEPLISSKCLAPQIFWNYKFYIIEKLKRRLNVF